MSNDALRPFVVTGTARSATTYMSELLSRLGLQCGHEVVFGPKTRAFDGLSGQHGDASWLAAPFLHDLPPEALVFHRVRHPLKVVRSLLGTRMLADRSTAFLLGDDAYTRVKWLARTALTQAGHVPASTKGPRPHRVYRDFLATFAPQVWGETDEAARALRYWHDWTRMIMTHSCSPQYQRHYVETATAATVASMLSEVGVTVQDRHVQMVIDALPDDVNTRGTVEVTWDDLPHGSARDDAARLARELGYNERDPKELPHA